MARPGNREANVHGLRNVQRRISCSSLCLLLITRRSIIQQSLRNRRRPLLIHRSYGFQYRPYSGSFGNGEFNRCNLLPIVRSRVIRRVVRRLLRAYCNFRESVCFVVEVFLRSARVIFRNYRQSSRLVHSDLCNLTTLNGGFCILLIFNVRLPSRLVNSFLISSGVRRRTRWCRGRRKRRACVVVNMIAFRYNCLLLSFRSSLISVLIGGNGRFLRVLISNFVPSTRTIRVPSSLAILLLVPNSGLVVRRERRLNHNNKLLALRNVCNDLLFFSGRSYPGSPFLLLDLEAKDKKLRSLLFLTFHCSLKRFHHRLLVGVVTLLCNVPSLRRRSFLLGGRLTRVLYFCLATRLPRILRRVIRFRPGLVVIFRIYNIPIYCHLT